MKLTPEVISRRGMGMVEFGFFYDRIFFFMNLHSCTNSAFVPIVIFRILARNFLGRVHRSQASCSSSALEDEIH